ncbi:helix-turn-helix domain-containing protein [Millisia brevis]|uniref:helix-turn-helix domain-containing protein n=1 Tax=Millisia brevis TaxID=264148 RepID=UPI00082EF890|nr:helix-turn-helix domain-containing protein [Millisia brevis]
MTGAALESQTFLPRDAAALAPVASFLAAHQKRRGSDITPRYALVGIDEHDRVELPPAVHHILLQVVTALEAGKAVTVAPQNLTLTTQEAADLLGVSRPTVVRLIRTGELAAERIGNRHRLRLDDVLAYREVRRQRQYDFLSETSVDITADDDPESVRRHLREVRRAAGVRRRAAE